MSNTITAYFKGRIGVAESVYQNDYGIVMAFDSIDLPAHFDCYFSRLNQEEALPGLGADNRVTIPNSILANPGNVTIHIPLHTGEDDSEVEYVIYFKVIGRARPIDDGTPAQMTAIERALALLSQPITNIEEIVNEALSFTGDTFAEMKQELADDFAEYKGDVDDDIADFKTEIRGDIADVEHDFDILDGQFQTAVAAITVDSEVQGIRTGDDGVTYTSAGNAVRKQFSDVKDALSAVKDNRNIEVLSGVTADEISAYNNLLYIQAYNMDLTGFALAGVLNTSPYLQRIILTDGVTSYNFVMTGNHIVKDFPEANGFIAIGYDWSKHTNDVNRNYSASHLKIKASIFDSLIFEQAITSLDIGMWYRETAFSTQWPAMQIDETFNKVYFRLIKPTSNVKSVQIYASNDNWDNRTLLYSTEYTEFIAEIDTTGFNSLKFALTLSQSETGTFGAIIHKVDDFSITQELVKLNTDITDCYDELANLKVPKTKLTGTAYTGFYLDTKQFKSISGDSFVVKAYPVTKGETYYFYGENVRLSAALPIAAFGTEAVANNNYFIEKILDGHTTNTDYAVRYTPKMDGYIYIAIVTTRGELSLYNTQYVSNDTNEPVKESVKVQLFGDSITDNEWGDTTTWADYIDFYLSDYYVTVLNEAVGGSGIGHGKSTTTPSHQTEDYNYVYDLVTDGVTLDTTADAIVILIGTNNWSGGTALGDMSSSGYSTVYGALKGILDYISANSDAIVFVCTIPQRYNSYDAERATNAYGEPLNSNGISLADYCEPFRKLSAFYGYPCIHLNEALGWNRNNVDDYTTDGLHPNAKGDSALAKFICSEIEKHLYKH